MTAESEAYALLREAHEKYQEHLRNEIERVRALDVKVQE